MIPATGGGFMTQEIWDLFAERAKKKVRHAKCNYTLRRRKFTGRYFFSNSPHQWDDIVRVECAGRLGRISDFLERRQN